ncbi:conserved hypothetical protein [uncultured Microbacterium sp.]|uniref:Ribbon-helix-helix protein CopG domain-containing protein n=1 Tax=uncultured Microbacterium sp. TaxID=191216 RepID=A0A1Y5NV29_9MICO|nr:conserved hypothetical protein [uncultured Microbacterium sp.]
MTSMRSRSAGEGAQGGAAEPSQVVALRLTIEELTELDALASRAHKPRSEIIRAALAAYAA